MSADAELITLFALVLIDSLGVPAPGDSALLVAGALASEGRVSTSAVIVVASVAAVLGDTIVFWFGRLGGRRLLLRDGRFVERRRHALARAEAFFTRFGLPAVFLAKFVPGVRGVAALAAGISGMRWPAFAVVNAVACVSWTVLAVTVGSVLGPTLVVAGLVGVCVVAAVVWGAGRYRSSRV